MAAQRKFDMVVVTGTYTDRNGNEKKNYETIGTVFETDRGLFATMKKTFNPAGVTSDRDSIMVSFFEPKAAGATGGKPVPKQEDIDSDIPW